MTLLPASSRYESEQLGEKSLIRISKIIYLSKRIWKEPRSPLL